MIKSVVHCLPYCDDCPYWETSYEEQVCNSFDEIQYAYRVIKLQYVKDIDKEKEKRAAEDGII